MNLTRLYTNSAALLKRIVSKKARDEHERQRGRAYANKIVKEFGPVAGVNDLETDVETAKIFGTANAFDRGIQEVIREENDKYREEHGVPMPTLGDTFIDPCFHCSNVGEEESQTH